MKKYLELNTIKNKFIKEMLTSNRSGCVCVPITPIEFAIIKHIFIDWTHSIGVYKREALTACYAKHSRIY
jgi:hypothetical protein